MIKKKNPPCGCRLRLWSLSHSPLCFYFAQTSLPLLFSLPSLITFCPPLPPLHPFTTPQIYSSVCSPLLHSLCLSLGIIDFPATLLPSLPTFCTNERDQSPQRAVGLHVPHTHHKQPPPWKAMQVHSHQPPTPAWWLGFTFFSLQTWSGLRNPLDHFWSYLTAERGKWRQELAANEVQSLFRNVKVE